MGIPHAWGRLIVLSSGSFCAGKAARDASSDSVAGSGSGRAIDGDTSVGPNALIDASRTGNEVGVALRATYASSFPTIRSSRATALGTSACTQVLNRCTPPL